jgi:hypothetical protein
LLRGYLRYHNRALNILRHKAQLFSKVKALAAPLKAVYR